MSFGPMSTLTREQIAEEKARCEYYKNFSGMELSENRIVDCCQMAIVDRCGNFYFDLPSHHATLDELRALCDDGDDYIPE